MHDILLPSNRIVRLRNAYRFPDEAAFLARVPLAGRRVPLRGYWQHRPINPGPLWREMLISSPVFGSIAGRFISVRGLPSRTDATRRATVAVAGERAEGAVETARKLPEAMRRVRMPRFGSATAVRARERLDAMTQARDREQREEIERLLATQRRRTAWPRRSTIVASIVAGGLAMYYFDRSSGRRRRALVKDQLAHLKHVLGREVPHRVEKRARFFRGVARGWRHEAAGVVTHYGPAYVDDETLVARVRSEVLGHRGIKSGEIHLDAYEGTLTLRGQLQYPDEIRRLIEDTSRVDGVRRVRSYLHLPGTLAPNKAEIYELERAPYSGG